ncbi:MAG: SDR family oxidoreductase [Anaerolineae bacterium]|nr:SDR family oxidoreductase [Anaerolineae bacterium]
MNLDKPFDFSGKVAVVTGGGGVLCSTLSRALAQCGASVAVLDINLPAAEKVAEEIRAQGGQAIAVQVDVLKKESLQAAAEKVLETFGRVDILINGAGGNKKEATTSDELSFFDLPADAIRWVFDLNFIGTLLPSQVFGRYMVEQGSGCILNISSMAAFRPLTRTVAYSPAKAAVSNFTQWLAVHISQNYSDKIRVNAIAPGFFLTEQNRFLLIDEKTGELTPRGRAIIDHTPMGHFGDPKDLIGAVLWLLSDGASFVHGAVIPIDGGFSAYSGV